MGEPYPVESGDYSYTHTRLANFPYEARYKSLLALLRQDITCEKTREGGVYLNRFKKHSQSAVKHIAYLSCLGWSLPSLTVCPCLSQDFVAGGNSLRWDERTKRGIITLPY